MMATILDPKTQSVRECDGAAYSTTYSTTSASMRAALGLSS